MFKNPRRATMVCAALFVTVLPGSIGAAAAARAPEPATTSDAQPVVWWVPGPDVVDGTSENIAAAFTEQTGIPVELEITPWDGYSTKLTTAIASGEVPDIAVLGNTDVPTMSASGAFMPWDDAALDAVGGRDIFVQAALDAYVPEGEDPASIPFSAGAWCLLYNKEMFAAAGIDGPPLTWDEFEQTAAQLSDPDNERYGVAIAGGTPGAMSTWAWIVGQQFGVPYYDADGNPAVNTPAMVDAMTSLVSWVPDGLMDPAAVADNSNGDNALFTNDQVAMDITQNPQAALDNPDKYGISLIPLPDPMPADGREIMTHVAGVNLAIFNDSDNQENAIRFAEFLVSPEAQVMEAIGNPGLPVTLEALQDPYFQTPSMQAYGEILANYSAATPTEPTSSQLLQGVGDALVRLYQNSAATMSVDPADVERELAEVEATIMASS